MIQKQIEQIFSSMTFEDFQSRFQFERTLGNGATADVFLAFDSQSESYVAVKKLKSDIVRYHSKYPIRQALTGQIKNQNLMKIHSAISIAKKTFYLILEYCEMGTLEEYLQTNQLTQQEKLRLFSGLVKGIQALHEHNFMHRDLKPENVFLTKDEKGKIMSKIGDFGCSKREEVAQTMFIGTAYYSDPITIQAQYTIKCDIFSLGVILFELFVGQNPFHQWKQLPFMSFREKQKQYLRNLKQNLRKKENLLCKMQQIVYYCLVEEKHRYNIHQLAEKVKPFLPVEGIHSHITNDSESSKKVNLVKQEEKKISSIHSKSKQSSQISQKQRVSSVSKQQKKMSSISKGQKLSQISLQRKINSELSASEPSQISTKRYLQRKTKSLRQTLLKHECGLFSNNEKQTYKEKMGWMNQLTNKKLKVTLVRKQLDNLKEYRKVFKQKLSKVNSLAIEKKDRNIFIFFIFFINHQFIIKEEQNLKSFQIKQQFQKMKGWFKKNLQIFRQNTIENINDHQPEISGKLAALIQKYSGNGNNDLFRSYCEEKMKYLSFKEPQVLLINSLLNPTF